jgi:hypothetical protein
MMLTVPRGTLMSITAEELTRGCSVATKGPLIVAAVPLDIVNVACTVLLEKS